MQTDAAERSAIQDAMDTIEAARRLLARIDSFDGAPAAASMRSEVQDLRAKLRTFDTGNPA